MADTLDRIFPDVGETDVGPGGNDKSDYDNRVDTLIKDAKNFEDSYLSVRRQLSTAYYNGNVPDIDRPTPAEYDSTDDTEESEDDGKSKFVSTDTRDTVMTMLPSLIRIFTEDGVVTFTPASEGGQDMADMALDYVNYVFWEDNDGFLIVHSLLKDCLINRVGIAQWWTDTIHEVSEEQYQNITPEQLMTILAEYPEAEVTEQIGDEQMLRYVSIKYVKSKPEQVVEAVPPEEFRISSDAKNPYTANLIGRERYVSVGSLVRLGLPEGVVQQVSGNGDDFAVDKLQRNPAMADTQFILGNQVLHGEYYIRADKDEDGIDELRFIRTIGEDHQIVEDYAVSHVNFALFCPDPVPHTSVGDSIVDQVMDIQRIKTNIIRHTLDNLANSARPRTAFNELLASTEDVMNPEQSAVIRVRGNPAENVTEFSTEFVGDKTFAMIDQLDKYRAARTGITEASKGLDPRAMQSTALAGVDAIISGAQERIELVARLLAHTGFKHLFAGLLREVINNPNRERQVKLRGKWTQVDPSLFDPNLVVKVNPVLGKGSDVSRLATLNEVKATQTMIIEKFGVKNPVVGPNEFRNTIVDILTIAGIKNPARYFKEITPEVEQQIMETPDEPSPEQLLAQAELEKVKANTAKAISDKEGKEQQMILDENFRRDKLITDATLEVMSIFAQYPDSPDPDPDSLGELEAEDRS